MDIDNDNLTIFTDEEIYTEEFWYNKVISPTEDLEEFFYTSDLESYSLDNYDSTEISLASSGGPTRYRTEIRQDPFSASMERWYRYSRNYTFSYMWGYGIYTSTETHWIHVYTMVGHSIPGSNWAEATVKIHSKAITGGTYPGERNISANNLRLGSSSDSVLIVPNLTNQSYPNFSMKFTGRSSEHLEATKNNLFSSLLSTVNIATAPLGTKGAILNALVQGTDLVVRNLSSSSNTSWANISDPNVKSLPTSFDRQYLEDINSQFSVKSRTSPPLEAHKSSSIYSAFIHIPIYHGSTKVSEIEFHDGLPAFPNGSYYQVY